MSIGLGFVALVSLAACGATTPTSAPTAVPSATSAPTETVAAPAEATATTEATAEATVATDATAEATAEATPTSEATAETATATATTSEASVFQIDPARSKASFTLGEVLMGSPKTVVGTTSKVTGVISASFEQPASAQLGVIQIDASDLRTDSNMRDRSIQRFILETTNADYQYITFEPTAIEGLPTGAVAVGTPISFKVTGNLKIRSVVQPVTFDTTVTATSDTELSGTATVTVTRALFELNIPRVQNVADVTDDVKLDLEFVATKQ